ncbi:uncharacterized protein [Coffea arabica]|uniref:U1-type domain-containing protein n=1 Tax=Coffea arabica TaxID=13443 RepID=A0ABM4UPA0_COFAR
MEFKYRAVDEPPPPPPPQPYYRHPTASSSGYSYFTEQAIRAGYRIPSSGRANEYFNSGPGWANDCFNADFGQVNEYIRNRLDVREAIQRELEKERIREEIIAAERQALEAEVRREMMMERELAIRARRGRVDAFDRFSFPFGGAMEFQPRDVLFLHNKGQSLEERIAMSLEERLGMRERHETGRLGMVPLQHGSIEPKIKEFMSSPADVKKDKIVILAKPDASLLGAKRKAVPPEEEGAGDLSGGVSKKKVEEEWSCALCQVSATSERGLNDHIQGKKHKSKEAALRAQRNGNNIGIGTFPKKDIKPSVEAAHKVSSEMGLKSRGELSQFKQTRESSLLINSSTERTKENNVSISEESDKTDNTRKKNLGVQKAPNKGQKKKKICTFWCEMCQVGAYNESVMEAHRKGKKHMNRLQEADEATIGDDINNEDADGAVLGR